MKNIILVITISLGLFIKLSAQTKIDCSQIGVFAIDEDYKLRFFKDINGRYQEVLLEYNFRDTTWDINGNTFINGRTLERTIATPFLKVARGRTKTLNELLLSKTLVKVFYKNDITSMSFTEISNKSFEYRLPNESIKYFEKDFCNTVIFNILNKTTAVLSGYYIGEINSESKRYFKCIDNDSIPKWGYLSNKEQWHLLDLDLGKEKHIYSLIEPYREDKWWLISLENETILLDEWDELYSIQATDFTLSKSCPLRRWKSDTYITLHYDSLLKKYYLHNIFQDNILNEKYDTIYFNDEFIVGRDNDKVTVYNSRFEELTEQNILSAQFAKYGLIDILTNNGPSYYTSNFVKLNEEPNLASDENELIDGLYYKLSSNINTSSNYSVIKTKRGRFSKEIYPFEIENTQQFDSLRFLDFLLYSDLHPLGKRSHKNLTPYLIIAQKGKKFGLLALDYSNGLAENIVDITDTVVTGADFLRETTITHTSNPIKSKLIMPIKMDSIIYNKYQNLTYFYQKGKAGIYPYHNKVKYDSITQVSSNFYRIRIGKKEGWLDIKTMKEYF